MIPATETTARHTFVRHQPSGDIYAVEIDAAGDIIRAAGPVPFGERFTDPADWIANALDAIDALDDGDWLACERVSYLRGDQRV